MKRYILIVATVALATVSCSRHYDVNTPDPQAIGFGTWAETLTKASHATGDKNTAFANGEAFDVFGFKNTNDVVFTGQNVVYNSTDQAWSYTDTRFWDPSASSYTFFAVLPADKLNLEHANNSENGYAKEGLFVSSPILFNNPTSYTNDILIADKEPVTPTGSAGSFVYTNPVALKFNHAAASVDFKVKQDNALGSTAVVTVTDFSLINISNTGSFAVSGYAASSPHKPTIGWTEATTPTYLGEGGVYSIISSGSVTAGGKTDYDQDSDPDADNDVDDSATELFSDYVFMPQTLTASRQQLKISYTITIGSEVNTYTDKVFDLCDFMTNDSKDNTAGSKIAVWEAGTHYTYFITIGANAITFTASVKGWTESTNSGYQYLVK